MLTKLFVVIANHYVTHLNIICQFYLKEPGGNRISLPTEVLVVYFLTF